LTRNQSGEKSIRCSGEKEALRAQHCVFETYQMLAGCLAPGSEVIENQGLTPIPVVAEAVDGISEGTGPYEVGGLTIG
jgi:hypothetical protein